MRILKAYADAGAMGQQSFGNIAPGQAEQGAVREKPKASKSGDSVSLSEEAREMLESGGQAGLTVTPQDATYDQHGNVMRQFDNLQSELRSLASQFMLTPGAQGMMGEALKMQGRVAGLRAQV